MIKKPLKKLTQEFTIPGTDITLFEGDTIAIIEAKDKAVDLRTIIRFLKDWDEEPTWDAVNIHLRKSGYRKVLTPIELVNTALIASPGEITIKLTYLWDGDTTSNEDDYTSDVFVTLNVDSGDITADFSKPVY